MREDDFLELCQRWLGSKHFHHVVTLNPEMVMLAETHEGFSRAVQHADIRVPDGSGLIWAHWYIRSQFWSLLPSLIAFSFRHAERIPGVDIVVNLCRIAAHRGLPVYLLGGTAAQVSGAAEFLKRQFPDLIIQTSKDHSFDVTGPPAILEDIRAKQPHILFVAYGAPGQTLWIEKNRNQLPSVRIATGVGGAFAILSEATVRAPRWLRRLNLEWLWRLLLEPARFPRIWRAVVAFPRLVHRQKKADT